MNKTLYFDYAASTPIDVRVLEKMVSCLTDRRMVANAASNHDFGRHANIAIENARAEVAYAINAESDEIIFTSGATESDNLALKGVARLYKRKGKHIVTMSTEHKAILDVCQHLEKEGFEIAYLKPDANGLINIDELKESLREDTVLVSIMHVNNETGVIQDIHRIGSMTRERNILFHVDAAQGIGKTYIDVKHTPIDLLSLSAHKVYGPKGVGALYLCKKPRVRVEPLIHGGGHEQGMRSGTLPTHQIVGMGEAFRLARVCLKNDIQKMQKLRQRFLRGLKQNKVSTLDRENSNHELESDYLSLNVPSKYTVPNIINLRFHGMIADALLANLPQVAASTASACQGKGIEGSYVLRALGLTQSEVQSSVRFSFGRFTSEEAIDELIYAITSICTVT